MFAQVAACYDTCVAAAAITEWTDVDEGRFQAEIMPLGQPAVLRQAARHWPAVQAAQAGALIDYMARFDQAGQVDLVQGDETFEGQFFYNSALDGLNFTRARMPFGQALALICAEIDEGRRASRSVQATHVATALPGFDAANTLAFAPYQPRLWIGGRVSIRTHIDYTENIACVVAGRRRFLLFPPDQIANLYVGPLDRTPSGSPVSMVDPNHPDLQRHPRFATALAHAQSAELEPGDAIYIPYMWWHHVDSLAPFNMLVNYWWNDAPTAGGAPLDALLFAMLNLRLAPERQRQAWRAAFDYFVFQTQGDPVAHLPPGREGVQGPPTKERVDYITLQILRKLVRKDTL